MKIETTEKNSDGEDEKHTYKLSDFASEDDGYSMDNITRENQKPYITVTAEIDENANATLLSRKLQDKIDKYKAPGGYEVKLSGDATQTTDMLKQMGKALALGFMLIYLVMVAQFQSLKSPFIIMFTIPLAFTGGFLALLITGFDISVVSLVGFVMLCGIIVNNGIVLVDYINKLRIDGKERIESIVEAGKTRMRPILITALTTVLGLVVMALGIGTGAEMMQPIAIVCIGGLLYATFMTLYIVPVIYDLFNKKELKKVSDEDLEFIDE